LRRESPMAPWLAAVVGVVAVTAIYFVWGRKVGKE
jgi:hypothetical protein